jgi:hypothetical protein
MARIEVPVNMLDEKIVQRLAGSRRGEQIGAGIGVETGLPKGAALRGGEPHEPFGIEQGVIDDHARSAVVESRQLDLGMRIENRNASDDRRVGQPEQRSVIAADAPVPSLLYLSDKLASGNSAVVPTPSVMVTLSPETRKTGVVKSHG